MRSTARSGVLIAALVVAGQPWAQAASDYATACQQADTRISAYEQALQSGDKAAITRTGLELQADPLAVRRLNLNGSESTRVAHNELTAGIKNQTEALAAQQIADRYHTTPDKVTFYSAQNPQEPGKPTKVGQDWDVTARVNGRDVPPEVSESVIHNSYYEAAGGKNTFGDRTASQVAVQQGVEVTSYQHPVAYGGGAAEGPVILDGPKDQRLRDPTQMSEVTKYKSDLAGQQAEALEAQGRNVEAQGWRVEEARQGVKQYDAQVQPRVEAMGGQVPNQVQEGVKVLRDVEQGNISPEEGRTRLGGMGETPQSIVDKSAGLIEASQTLKNPSERGPAASDVFVDNVKDRANMTRAEQGRAPIGEEGLAKPESRGAAGVVQEDGSVKVPKPLTEGQSSFQEPGVGDRIKGAAGEVDGRLAGAVASELPANASVARQTLNAAGEQVVKGVGAVGAAVAVVETAKESYQGGRAFGEGLQALAAGNSDKATQKFGEAADKGKTVGVIMGLTAAAEAMPTTAALLAAGVGGYQGGRVVLENTKAGQAVDRATLNAMDGGTRAAEALPDAVRNALGIQTRDQRELSQRQETYLRALASGQIQLNDGVTVKDLMDQVKYGQPGTKEYQDRMNELFSRNQNPPDKKPGDIADQLNSLAAQITDSRLSKAEREKAQLEYLQILEQIKKPKDEDKDKGAKPGEGGESETNAPATEVGGGSTNAPGDGASGEGTNETGEVSGGSTNGTEPEVAGGETNGSPEVTQGEEPGEEGGGGTEVTSGEEGNAPEEGESGEITETTPESQATEAGQTVFGGAEESNPPAEPEEPAGEEVAAGPDQQSESPQTSESSGSGESLESSEAGYGEGGAGDDEGVNPNTDGGIQQFAQNNEENLPGTDEITLLGTASQVGQASTAGDGEILTANNTRNNAGADAQTTINQSASETAGGDAQNSWGNAIGNGLQQGLEQGLSQAGTAVGEAVADGVANEVYPPHHPPTSDSSGGSSSGQVSDGSGGGSSGSGGSGGGGGPPAVSLGGGSGGDGGSGGGGAAPPVPGNAGGGGSEETPPDTSGGGGGGGGGGSSGGGSVVVTASGSAGGGAGGGSTGASGSGSGGYAAGPQDQTIDGSGSLAGRTVTGVKVTLNYNAYDIPDSFQILYGGSSIASTGPTSGGGTLTGNGSGSTPSVVIRVISSQDQSTAWEWSASVEFLVASGGGGGGGGSGGTVPTK